MLMRSLRLLVMAAAVFTVSCADGPQSPVSPTSTAAAPTAQNNGAIASTAAPKNSAAKFEQDFMMDMIDHHEMAIQMAQLCLDKQTPHDAELDPTCNNIITTQRREQQQMQTWLREWYGISYQPQMKPGDMRMIERMGALSGAEFEIEFMEMMIRHHRKAVREGEQCVRKAYHEELIQMCRNIIEAQTEEIRQFEQWLCQWYGRCGGTR